SLLPTCRRPRAPGRLLIPTTCAAAGATSDRSLALAFFSGGSTTLAASRTGEVAKPTRRAADRKSPIHRKPRREKDKRKKCGTRRTMTLVLYYLLDVPPGQRVPRKTAT